MSISAKDRERISTAIRAAEARTSGEIICILAQASSDATALPILVAAMVALAVPWLLVAVTAMPVNRILLLQAVVFFVLAMLLCLPRMRVALVPRAARRAIAHRVAMEQFILRGVERTKDRTGVLIFVSLAERYARIIADRGIAARVPQSEWQGAVDVLVAHMSGGRIADGFIAAIDACGKVLEAHFPRSETSRDELPDRIYLI
jgi:putative membrane protein